MFFFYLKVGHKLKTAIIKPKNLGPEFCRTQSKVSIEVKCPNEAQSGLGLV